MDIYKYIYICIGDRQRVRVDENASDCKHLHTSTRPSSFFSASMVDFLTVHWMCLTGHIVVRRTNNDDSGGGPNVTEEIIFSLQYYYLCCMLALTHIHTYIMVVLSYLAELICVYTLNKNLKHFDWDRQNAVDAGGAHITGHVCVVFYDDKSRMSDSNVRYVTNNDVHV